MASAPAFQLDIADLRQSELDELAGRLFPHLLARLRALAPAEARAIAGEAAEHRPLDGVSLAALADWLRDQQFDSAADLVADLRPGTEKFLIFQMERHLSPLQMTNLRNALTSQLPDYCRAIILPPGIDLAGITSKE